MGAVVVADKKKPASNAAGSGGKKQNPSVKLSPEFHQKLKIIADDVGLDMGDLVEREMEEFVARESKRIALKLLGGPQG